MGGLQLSYEKWVHREVSKITHIYRRRPWFKLDKDGQMNGENCPIVIDEPVDFEK